MAAIIEFTKPVPWGVGAATGAEHSFLLLQNDAGQYTEIARGGPQNDNPLIWGQITATVADYTRYPDISGKAANDFYTADQLATMPSRVLATGTEAEMQTAFDRLGTEVGRRDERRNRIRADRADRNRRVGFRDRYRGGPLLSGNTEPRNSRRRRFARAGGARAGCAVSRLDLAERHHARLRFGLSTGA